MVEVKQQLYCLPPELWRMIIEDYLPQQAKLKLAETSSDMRHRVLFAGNWGDSLTICNVENLPFYLVRYAVLFAGIKRLFFGKHAKGIRPGMLAILSRLTPKLSEICIARVASDNQFLFGYHVFPTHSLSRSANHINEAELESSCLYELRYLFTKLTRLRIHIRNYSLGLYMLIDRFKHDCPNLVLEVVVDEQGTVRRSTALNQFSSLLGIM